jgi:hypothetical protein
MRSLLLLFVLFLLLPVVVSSQPPFGGDDLVFGEDFFIVYNTVSYYRFGDDFSFCWLVFNGSNGLMVDNSSVGCVFRLCDVNTCLVNGVGSWDGGKWFFNVSNVSVGVYNFYIYCNSSSGGGGVLHNFVVSNSGEPPLSEFDVLLVLPLLFIPLFLSWLFIRWVGLLGDEHNVFKLFLSFGSLIGVLVGAWFLVEGFSRFVFWVGGSDGLSLFVFVFGWLLFAIFGYWFVFMIYSIFRGLMRGKDEKFEY